MTEETKIPEWALKEAFSRAGLAWFARGSIDAATRNMARAFAEMIVKHEQPPVDRATRITREVLARWAETNKKGTDTSPTYLSKQIRDGAWDNLGDFKRARDYLAGELDNA